MKGPGIVQYFDHLASCHRPPPREHRRPGPSSHLIPVWLGVLYYMHRSDKRLALKEPISRTRNHLDPRNPQGIHYLA